LHEHRQSHHDLITFNGHPFSLASCFSLMDEIFSLHEHRHLITFNGHRILLVFLVNLWNPEYTKIIRHFYYII
jgi:hypothetical protein